jgi:hypothetical protein
MPSLPKEICCKTKRETVGEEIFKPPVRMYLATKRNLESIGEVVSGHITRRQWEELLAHSMCGAVQVFYNCTLLTEGYDFPANSTLVIARPTLSPTLYLQMLDKGVRKAGGEGWMLGDRYLSGRGGSVPFWKSPRLRVRLLQLRRRCSGSMWASRQRKARQLVHGRLNSSVVKWSGVRLDRST